MDDVTNDVTDDITNRVTEGVTNGFTDDQARARHISDLIVNCCHMNPTRHIFYELAFMTAFANCDPDYLLDPDITGSSAEFYIEHGRLCIGDVDLMVPSKKFIVMCAGSFFVDDVNGLLVVNGSVVDSIDVNETIKVCQIETSNCPNGYVYSRLIGNLQFNWETNQFDYRASNNMGEYSRLKNSYWEENLLHGPA